MKELHGVFIEGLLMNGKMHVLKNLFLDLEQFCLRKRAFGDSKNLLKTQLLVFVGMELTSYVNAYQYYVLDFFSVVLEAAHDLV